MEVFETFEKENRIFPCWLWASTPWEEDLERAKKLGFKNYITKPIDVPLFVDLIEKYL